MTTERIQSSTKETSGRVQTSTKEAWSKTKLRSKDWWNRVGDPSLEKATNKIGAETFWPTSLDRESQKAARILRSFCIDGFTAQDAKDLGGSNVDVTEIQLMKIPTERDKVIRECKGLAIFTVIRTGFLSSRSGGSGIIVAKQPDGKWSPPSGIVITALGMGFQAGADIYDCVCVIENDDGMDGFLKARTTMGGEVGVAAGPLGGGAIVGSEVHKRQAPVLTYTKGRGLYMGVQVKGTVIVERSSENERFYGVEDVKCTSILNGEVPPPSDSIEEVGQLWETLKAVQGDPHDKSKLPPSKDAPDDRELEVPKETSQAEYDDIGMCPEFSDEEKRAGQAS
ncbi:uncharacterized protein LTR77_001513 [Saxophila tyrrhenica]|uniref:Ysc84 actin-binding domain-containing protein n=1 Tax=Saxophila tyrrhenica TaxID=1690608 RepID=A0AAV9PKN7_9PEZI|nr:hypothetical protein LTR77_001513 [Saxophila tyrrhenica]